MSADETRGAAALPHITPEQQAAVAALGGEDPSGKFRRIIFSTPVPTGFLDYGLSEMSKVDGSPYWVVFTRTDPREVLAFASVTFPDNPSNFWSEQLNRSLARRPGIKVSLPNAIPALGHNEVFFAPESRNADGMTRLPLASVQYRTSAAGLPDTALLQVDNPARPVVLKGQRGAVSVWLAAFQRIKEFVASVNSNSFPWAHFPEMAGRLEEARAASGLEASSNGTLPAQAKRAAPERGGQTTSRARL